MGVAGAILGCASTPQITAGDLARRAESSVLQAQSDLAGRTVIVRGVVDEATVTSRERVEVSGGPWVGWSATATTREEQLPLIVLKPGSVWCYFEPDRISDVARLRPGAQVTFKCEIDHFSRLKEMTVSVLGGCRWHDD